MHKHIPEEIIRKSFSIVNLKKSDVFVCAKCGKKITWASSKLKKYRLINRIVNILLFLFAFGVIEFGVSHIGLYLINRTEAFFFPTTFALACCVILWAVVLPIPNLCKLYFWEFEEIEDVGESTEKFSKPKNDDVESHKHIPEAVTRKSLFIRSPKKSDVFVCAKCGEKITWMPSKLNRYCLINEIMTTFLCLSAVMAIEFGVSFIPIDFVNQWGDFFLPLPFLVLSVLVVWVVACFIPNLFKFHFWRFEKIDM